MTCVDPKKTAMGGIDWNNGSDYAIIRNLVLLTGYDGTSSIMSYCRDWDQNGTFDYPPFSSLSALDALGIEMMYPRSLGRKAVLDVGISNFDGSRYIVRSDRETTLNVDWIFRGGLTSSIHNVQWANQFGVFSTSPNPSIRITTTETIQVQLDDAFNRHHPWTLTTAIPSNAEHAAIVMSASVVP